LENEIDMTPETELPDGHLDALSDRALRLHIRYDEFVQQVGPILPSVPPPNPGRGVPAHVRVPRAHPGGMTNQKIA
jgi:hypothetical protein